MSGSIAERKRNLGGCESAHPPIEPGLGVRPEAINSGLEKTHLAGHSCIVRGRPAWQEEASTWLHQELLTRAATPRGSTGESGLNLC
jgi:hypothetical protein